MLKKRLPSKKSTISSSFGVYPGAGNGLSVSSLRWIFNGLQDGKNWIFFASAPSTINSVLGLHHLGFCGAANQDWLMAHFQRTALHLVIGHNYLFIVTRVMIQHLKQRT